MRRRPARFAPAVLVLSLAACSRADGIFDRYVAMGSSSAAGWQSGGIASSTQAQAYPAVLAALLHTKYLAPSIAEPGCPAPATAPMEVPTGTPCARGPRPFDLFFQNGVAVPGTRLADALAAPAAPGAELQDLLIGPGSQVEAMKRAEPTFLSVQLGDDDVFEAAIAGRITDDILTPLADFEASLDALAAEIESVKTLQGVILLGVTDPVATVPLLQPGSYYFLARDPPTGRFQGKLVNANCSPVTPLGTPNPLSANLISMRITSDAGAAEINCDPAAYTGDHLLSSAEAAVIRTRVAQYNAAIQALAASHGWLYLDPNTVWAPQLALRTNSRYDAVRKCQLLPAATTAASFQTAVLYSCPVTYPTTAAPGFFGSLVSYDGVHLTAAGHELLAQAMRDAIALRTGPVEPE